MNCAIHASHHHSAHKVLFGHTEPSIWPLTVMCPLQCPWLARTSTATSDTSLWPSKDATKLYGLTTTFSWMGDLALIPFTMPEASHKLLQSGRTHTLLWPFQTGSRSSMREEGSSVPSMSTGKSYIVPCTPNVPVTTATPDTGSFGLHPCCHFS